MVALFPCIPVLGTAYLGFPLLPFPTLVLGGGPRDSGHTNHATSPEDPEPPGMYWAVWMIWTCSLKAAQGLNPQLNPECPERSGISEYRARAAQKTGLRNAGL